MRHTLTLPDGRTLTHHSAKRWHVVRDEHGTLSRVSSSDERSRALSSWRRADLTRSWVIDGDTGEIIRTPMSPRL